MYLSNIYIENFKGIKKAAIDFDRAVNLIIGDNGTGKTSVLEAIAVALGGFLSGIDGVNTIHFSKDEIRRENQLTGTGSNNIVYKTPVCVSARLELDIGDKDNGGVHSFKFSRQKRASRARDQRWSPGISAKQRSLWLIIQVRYCLSSVIRAFHGSLTRKEING